MSSHGHYEDIGPPASYNQLPQPEGDWQQNHDKKQAQYNAILLGSALFFAGTFVFVSLSPFQNEIRIFSAIQSKLIKTEFLLFKMKQSGIIFWNAYPPDTYE